MTAKTKSKMLAPDVTSENQKILEELDSRNAELAILNSIQDGVASGLDIDSIFELVGERITEIFPGKSVALYTYDPATHMGEAKYILEDGVRHYPPPFQAGPIGQKAAETKKPLVLSTRAEFEAIGAITIEGTAPSLCGMYIPLIVHDAPVGALNIESTAQEHAFSDSDLRLATTIASSLSVALENARLFDESQRLLRETEERNAELAIINTVQRALASQLDIGGIYEAVGEKLREIFDSQIIAIYSADLETRINTTEYAYEKGQKFEPVSIPFSALHDHLIELNDTYVFNGDFPEFAAQFADYHVSIGEMPKSLVGVPVRRKKGATKLLTLTLQDVDGEKIFTESDVRLLETLANSMSLALENARLFDESQRLLLKTEQRAAELQIINSVQEGLASKLDMQAIYNLVGDKIREIFEADTTFIAFHDVEKKLIIAPYYTDKGERDMLVSRPYGHGLAEISIESGKSLLLNTAQEMNEAGAFNVASPGSDLDLNQSFLGVPIFRNGKAIGATSVQSYQPYAFEANDLSLLQTLTNSMSVALENARLFDETQRLLQETEQRAAELASINTVSQALVAESDLDALLDLIGEQIRQTFTADIVYVALYDAQSNEIQFPYTYGDEFTTIKLGEGLTSKIIESGEPLIINREMDKRRAELGVAKLGVGARSYLGVPIQMRGQTFGVISVQSTREEGRFGQDDLHLLTTIAANVGTAIRNAQLFDEVKRRNKYYEAIIENSPAAIILLDLEANVTGWNPAAEKLFGYTEDEALGRNIDDLVAKTDALHSEAVRYSQIVLQEKQVHLLARRTRKDGSLVEVDVSGVPIRIDGKQEVFIAIYHDVSELQRARQAAEEANQAKSSFLPNMSHELRTPLNAIIGFSRIVRRKGKDVLPDKQVENLDKVLISAEHLLSLINTVLDISKIEAGRVDVQPTDFELPLLIDLVVGTSQPLMRKGVTLKTDLQTDLPSVYTDQDKLKQILINLVSNGAKFTHEGEIILSSRNDGERLYIDVNDTGIGISEDALTRIFEDFQQADSSTTREYGGTGLGIPISRSLARLLGGDLTACSIEGEGSTFTLTLPLRYSEPLRDEQQPVAELQG